MNNRWKRSSIILLAALLMGLVTAVTLITISPAQTANATTYETAITVDSSTDPDTSMSYTCSSPPADGLCTLRRAIVEARALPAALAPTVSLNFSWMIRITLSRRCNC